jgi:hypothetical protein
VLWTGICRSTSGPGWESSELSSEDFLEPLDDAIDMTQDEGERERKEEQAKEKILLPTYLA